MSQESVQRTERAVAAINETYRTGDLGPWRRYVEATYDPSIVLDATGGAFTEGEWQGHDGVVGFVANQMDVLDDMWLRVDDHIHDTDDCVVVAITFGGRHGAAALRSRCTPSISFGCATAKSSTGRSFRSGSRRSKPWGCGSRHVADDLALLSRRNGGVQALREAGATRLGLATSGVTGRRSNQLSYAPSKGA